MESIPFHRTLKRARGFTLIEMLVVLAIIVIVSAIALSNQSSFTRTLGLNNTAYDIGLSIRQAQSYGLSSQVYNTLNNVPYGIYFSANTSYILFADSWPAAPAGAQPDKAKPGNGQYNSGTSPPDSIVQTYALNNGYKISDYSVYSSTAGKICKATPTGGSFINGMAITFTRPNLETSILQRTVASGWSTTPYSSACVELTSPYGDTRFVTISQTGQVQVGSNTTIDVSSCPPCP